MLKVNSIYAYIELLSEEQKRRLIKHGWTKDDEYYFKEVGDFKLSLMSLKFADQVSCSVKGQAEVVRHVDGIEFNFFKGWGAMWNQNITPKEVHFVTLEDLEDKLFSNGWHCNSFLPEIIEFPSEGDLSHYSREDMYSRKPYYDFQDTAPGKTFEYAGRLKLAGLI